MNTSDRNREASGQPTGGRFAPQPHREADIALPGARTALGGYDVRGYKTAGTGMEGPIWSATIYRDGKAVIYVTDDGNGGDLRYVEKTSGRAHTGPEIDRLKQTAEKFHPEYGEYSDGVFVENLQFAAQLDKHARDNAMTFADTVEAHYRAGELTEDEREIFLRPEQFTV